MKRARSYLYKNKDIHKIYGFTDFEYTYIYDNFKKGFEFNFGLLNIVNTDIETDSSDGFPDIQKADKQITAITLAKKGKTLTFGYFPYESTETKVYVQCDTERELLLKFIKAWNSVEWQPDIVTGWNIEMFDIPYIINRIIVVLGGQYAEKLSPFGIIEEKEIEQRTGKIVQTFSIFGISIIDYYAAYKKFAVNERESYKLDFIAEYELGEKKVDYSEYGSLHNLYVQNPQLYYTYNIHDAVLIEKLENKLHYIEQIVNIAYIERVNYENTLSTVKPWDVIVHNYLMDNRIVVPQISVKESDYRIEGGYVKEPLPGYYEYVVSVDFTSLYPSIAMQYNMSPDTFVQQFPFKKENITRQFEKIINGDMSEVTAELKRRDYCMTANGCLFKRDKRGFVPTLMKEFFDERKRVRKLEAIAEKKYEEEKTDENRNTFLKHKNLQTAFKLINNSGYGAIANKYFRWFTNAIAEGITLTGQLTIKYVEDRINKYLNKKFKTEGVVYVVYCDTDSAYITLKEFITQSGIVDKDEAIKAIVKFAEEEMCPYIDSVCQELADKLNAFELKTSMKLEKVCDQVFFTAKKRYGLNVDYSEGIYYKEPKLKVTGLETVRSSVPKKCRKALEHTFKLIFKKDRQKLIEYVEEFRKEFYNMSFEDIAKPSSVQGLKEYYDKDRLYKKGCPMHVRGALIYNKFIQDRNLTNRYRPIEDHDKIKVCYLKLPNPTHQNVIAIGDDNPEELDIASYVDYNLQFDKTFIQPLQAVCDAVGWETKKVYTLDDIFGD